jgi:hypothetical protein
MLFCPVQTGFIEFIGRLKYQTGDFGAAVSTGAAAVLLSLYYQDCLPAIPMSGLIEKNLLYGSFPKE